MTDWLTIPQACEHVKRSRATIYRWISEGIVRTTRPGRQVYVYRADLDRAEATKTPIIGVSILDKQ